MATITKAKLRVLVARELKLIRSDRSSVKAEIGNIIDEYIDGVRDDLIESGLAYWAADAIPQAAKLWVAYIVAQEAQGQFSVEYSKGAYGLKKLKEHVASLPSGEPTRADYF